ncbi:MAG: carbamoyltransferase [Alphaproteobacteria bacterium]|nr:carbamoyltransferase [Alphaproteobacteria bacterium]
MEFGPPMNVLGINVVYHQQSAAIAVDGEILAAAEEERFTRIKGGKEPHVDNTLAFPFAATDFVLRQAGLRFSEIDIIATSFSPELRALHAAKWRSFQPVLGGEFETPDGDRAFRELIALIPAVMAARYGAAPAWVEARFRWVPHHLCHLASAYYASPFEAAAGVVIDGIGEFESTTIADCAPDGLRVLQQVEYPNSLGFVWEILTNFLGFKGNLDEGKIMGLAAYGNPEPLRPALRELIDMDDEGRFVTRLDPRLLDHDYTPLERAFGFRHRLPYEPLAWQGRDRRHADLAAALQDITNEVFLKLARRAHALTGRRHLVIAGGVGLNCVSNGLVAEAGPFEDLYVQPASGDAGTAVGAALHLCHTEGGRRKTTVPAVATHYLGPSFDDNEIREALKEHHLDHERVDPAEMAADLLAAGQVVGWFQGPMEWGPRALGNRSLLANPTLPGIRHVINLNVKHREEFRPFCPTILAEHAANWLVATRPFCQASRAMLATYPVRREKWPEVPSILHLDGSARVQILKREDNPLFHDLIEAFRRRTGVPMVLNTSFNDREPIVCTPADACACYLKTRFEAMILGPYLVRGPKPWERDPALTAFELEARRFDSVGPS